MLATRVDTGGTEEGVDGIYARQVGDKGGATVQPTIGPHHQNACKDVPGRSEGSVAGTGMGRGNVDGTTEKDGDKSVCPEEALEKDVCG